MLEFHARKTYPNFTLDAVFATDRKLAVILAPSGSGKSLILNMLSGIVTPDAGRMVIDGEVLYDSAQGIDVPVRLRRIGHVFQDYALFPHMTVSENIGYGIRDKARRRARMEELVRLFRLEGQERLYPAQLSGGQQQRVAIARSMANHPRLLLMDEPFSALDERIREQLQEVLLRLKAMIEAPILYVTHSLREASVLADWVLILNRGEVVEEGERDQVLFYPKRIFTARFLGFNNVYPCAVKEVQQGRAILKTARGDLQFAGECRHRPGERVHFGIGPRDVRLLVDEASRPNILSGVVTNVTTREKVHRVMVYLGDSGEMETVEMDIEQHTYARWGIKIGDRVQVYLREDEIFLCE